MSSNQLYTAHAGRRGLSLQFESGKVLEQTYLPRKASRAFKAFRSLNQYREQFPLAQPLPTPEELQVPADNWVQAAFLILVDTDPWVLERGQVLAEERIAEHRKACTKCSAGELCARGRLTTAKVALAVQEFESKLQNLTNRKENSRDDKAGVNVRGRYVEAGMDIDRDELEAAYGKREARVDESLGGELIRRDRRIKLPVKPAFRDGNGVYHPAGSLHTEAERREFLRTFETSPAVVGHGAKSGTEWHSPLWVEGGELPIQEYRVSKGAFMAALERLAAKWE